MNINEYLGIDPKGKINLFYILNIINHLLLMYTKTLTTNQWMYYEEADYKHITFLEFRKPKSTHDWGSLQIASKFELWFLLNKLWIFIVNIFMFKIITTKLLVSFTFSSLGDWN